MYVQVPTDRAFCRLQLYVIVIVIHRLLIFFKIYIIELKDSQCITIYLVMSDVGYSLLMMF